MATRAFDFEGDLPASKSLYNRWAILGSFEPRFQLRGDSTCDDVVKMKAALAGLKSGRPELDCGEAGTVLRFLAFRASRVPGTWRLTGAPRLFARPQDDLVSLLKAVGVEVRLEGASLVISGQGWQKPAAPIRVDRSRSSQFLSGLVLSAWELPFALPIEFEGDIVSELYWKMTRSVVLRGGMKLSGGRPGSFEVLPHQRVRHETVDVEPDLSSAFAVAALAALGGRAWIKNYPETSLQPDAAFVDILKRMGCEVEKKREGLEFRGTRKLKGIEVSLSDTPDLFPVLATLAALAEGPSKLFGAPHLIHKESNRIAGTGALLALVGAQTRALLDGMEILAPAAAPATFSGELVFDPISDHRLVMAAHVFIRAGYPIRLTDESCVAKSFPEFPEIARR